jgi:hypothetical protein
LHTLYSRYFFIVNIKNKEALLADNTLIKKIGQQFVLQENGTRHYFDLKPIILIFNGYKNTGKRLVFCKLA